MGTRRDIEELLRRIPLSTPAEVNAAQLTLETVLGMVNAAVEGSGARLPGISAVNVQALMRQLQAGNYADVAVAMITVVGDAAGAFSFLTSAAVEAGAISSLSAVGGASVVGGMLSGASGPAAIAATVLLETFRIPASVSENNAKLFFIADASGILTSWMFNLPEINPHNDLLRRARTGGYGRTDISEHCIAAHSRVNALWRRNYQGNSAAIMAARAGAGNNWERYWLDVGQALEQMLGPRPSGVGTAMVRGVISDARLAARRAASDASRRAERARIRREAGGEWVRSPDGIELFIPDV